LSKFSNESIDVFTPPAFTPLGETGFESEFESESGFEFCFES